MGQVFSPPRDRAPPSWGFASLRPRLNIGSAVGAQAHQDQGKGWLRPRGPGRFARLMTPRSSALRRPTRASPREDYRGSGSTVAPVSRPESSLRKSTAAWRPPLRQEPPPAGPSIPSAISEWTYALSLNRQSARRHQATHHCARGRNSSSTRPISSTGIGLKPICQAGELSWSR